MKYLQKEKIVAVSGLKGHATKSHKYKWRVEWTKTLNAAYR